MFVIISILVVALLVCFIVAYFRLDEQPVSEDFIISDFTFRSDHGGQYMVTATSVNEAAQLLHEDHDLPWSYIHNHVFLANVKEIF